MEVALSSFSSHNPILTITTNVHIKPFFIGINDLGSSITDLFLGVILLSAQFELVASQFVLET